MNLGGEDYKALHRTIPIRFIAIAERKPWEDAIAIGQQQPVYTQVATDGYQAVGLAQVWVGKPEFIIELKDHSRRYLCSGER